MKERVNLVVETLHCIDDGIIGDIIAQRILDSGL